MSSPSKPADKAEAAPAANFIRNIVEADIAGYRGDGPFDEIYHLASPAAPRHYMACPVETIAACASAASSGGRIFNPIPMTTALGPSMSPCASGRSHCSFCASLAYIMAMLQTGQLLTEMMVDVPPSPAARPAATLATGAAC